VIFRSPDLPFRNFSWWSFRDCSGCISRTYRQTTMCNHSTSICCVTWNNRGKSKFVFG
jgi:hypothetical protein